MPMRLHCDPFQVSHWPFSVGEKKRKERRKWGTHVPFLLGSFQAWSLCSPRYQGLVSLHKQKFLKSYTEPEGRKSYPEVSSREPGGARGEYLGLVWQFWKFRLAEEALSETNQLQPSLLKLGSASISNTHPLGEEHARGTNTAFTNCHMSQGARVTPCSWFTNMFLKKQPREHL